MDYEKFTPVPNFNTKHSSEALQKLKTYYDTKLTGLTWDDIFDNEDQINKELRPILDDIYKEWHDPYINNTLKNYDKNIINKIRADNIDMAHNYIFPITRNGKYDMPFDELRDIVINDAQSNASSTIKNYFKQKNINDIYIYDSPYTNPYWSRLAHTNEASDILLKNIKNSEISDIGIEKVIRANASAHKNDIVSHGLLAYGYKHNEDAVLQLKNNLHTVLNNKDIELSLTEESYKLGQVGITGKANITAYSPVDIMSIPNSDGTRRVQYGYQNDFLSLSKQSTYAEYFGKNFTPESMWVTKDFYQHNESVIHELVKQYDIQYLDIINDVYPEDANLFAIQPRDITRLKMSEIQNNTEHLTPQQAELKYGSYTDEYYSSQGKNPIQERQKIKEFYESKNLELPDDLKKHFNEKTTKDIVQQELPVTQFKKQKYNETIALGLDRVERLNILAKHGITKDTIGSHKIKSLMRLKKDIFNQFSNQDFDAILQDPDIYSRFLDSERFKFIQSHGGNDYFNTFENNLNQIKDNVNKKAKGFKLIEDNESWFHYGTVDASMKDSSKFSYKIYGTFENLQDFTPDNITSIMNDLTDAGFHGQLKHAGPYQADVFATSSDQLVIHGKTIKDQKIAYEVLNKKHSKLFSYLGGGIDERKVRSFSEILGDNSIDDVNKIINTARQEYNDFIKTGASVYNTTPDTKSASNIKDTVSKSKKYKPTKGPKLKEKISGVAKQSNPKYYTQDQLDTIFNFEHKRTAHPTNETKFKDVRYDEAGEHFDFTNFDEFQKIGGNKSFAKLIIYKDHQDIIKKYWNLLNKADGNPLIASMESKLLFTDAENQIIDLYVDGIDKAFTEHATNGMHNDITRYLKDNMDTHDKMVKHYLDTGEILNPYYQSQDLVTEETTEQIVKNTTEETIEEITEETGKQAEHNFKETLEQSAKEMAEESSKKVSKSTAKALPKKSLGGGGKAAIAIAGLIIGGIALSSDDKPKKKSEKSKAHSLPRSTNAKEFDNSYAMQMAQDISSYRYGKHMTGFVNQ